MAGGRLHHRRHGGRAPVKLKHAVLTDEAGEYMMPRDDCPAARTCSTRYAEWVNGWRNLQPERPDACPACEEAELARLFVLSAQG